MKETMFVHQERLQALSQKAIEGSITEDEFVELTQLSRAKQQIRVKREELISDLQKSVQTRKIAMQELFSSEAIVAAASTIRLPPTATQVTTVVRNHGSAQPEQNSQEVNNAPSTQRGRGAILIEISKPGVQGLPCRYRLGQTMSYYVPPAMKALENGNLESNLDSHTTEAGKVYFATEEGQAERAKLLEYIRTRRAKTKKA